MCASSQLYFFTTLLLCLHSQTARLLLQLLQLLQLSRILLEGSLILLQLHTYACPHTF